MSVGVRYNWPTAGVCAAFHPRIDFTPSLCPSSTPPLCNNNHQPTNQPYPTLLSYPILSYPTPSRNETSRSVQLVSLLLHFARAYGDARAHTLLTLAHEAHERAGTKNERGTSEREAREGVGGEGGGTHKGR